MSIKALPLLSLVLFFSACSNDRSNRISKSFLCEEENDLASQTLTESEKNDYTPSSLDFSKTNLKTKKAYVTLEVPDTAGNTVTFSFGNASIGSYPTRLGRSCVAGLEENSQSAEPVVFQLPLYTTDTGAFKYQETSLSFGHPEEEDLSDYISNETKFLPESDSKSEDELALAAPTSFNEIIPSAAQVYKKKDNAHLFLVLYTDDSIGLRAKLVIEEVEK